MAGLVPAIHVLANRKKGVDARVKPGHDESVGRLKPRRKPTTRVTPNFEGLPPASIALQILTPSPNLPLSGGGSTSIGPARFLGREHEHRARSLFRGESANGELRGHEHSRPHTQSHLSGKSVARFLRDRAVRLRR